MTETQFLKKFREARGLSQKELADVVGVSQQHIAKLEAGIHPVRLGVAVLISGALGKSMHEIFPTVSSESLTDGFAALENAAAARHEELMAELREHHEAVISALSNRKGSTLR